MEKIRIIWENIKIQPDIWLFFLFLFSFPLSTRKVILYFPFQRTFNEYAGIYIYISDILLVLTIVLWLFTILCNTKDYPSMYRLWITSLSHKLSPTSRWFSKSPYLSLPLLLVIWSFLSISWSVNHTIAFFRSAKLLEFYLLYLFIILRFVSQLFHVEHSKPNKTSTALRCSTWNIFSLIIILAGFIQSAIGIIQVLIQRSIGLSPLGESLIAPNIPGVAKILFHGERYIRAYGLFPHPNILGGYLLLSITLTLLFLKMFHACPVGSKLFQPVKCSDVPRGTSEHHGSSVEQFEFLRGGTTLARYTGLFPIILYVALALQIFALIFSFSKSAILGLAIALLHIYVPRGTKSLSSSQEVLVVGSDYSTPAPLDQNVSRLPRGMFHVEHSLRDGTFENLMEWNNSRLRIAILSILIIISLGLLTTQDLDRNLEQSIQERMTYLNVSRGTILASPVLGVGMGQFVWNMPKYALVPLEAWQFQPVHNVFFLTWSELGIIGLGLFIYWLYGVFTAKPILRNNNRILSMVIPLRYFKGILLGFIFIMLFDHYFWDIQQGSLMLWMTLGSIAGMKLYKNTEI